MEYLTAYYRQQGESGCSLLLQQYSCRQTPVCFACLCSAEGEEGKETCRNRLESLLNWSRMVPWHRAAGRPALWLERLGKELADLPEVPGAAADGDGRKLTLFLCIGEEMLALGGGQNLRLLSTSFGRGKAVELPGQFRGCLEPGAGLLLATDGFLKNTELRSLEETLCLREMKTAKQAERRLRELASPRELVSPRKLVSSRAPAVLCGQVPEPETAGQKKAPGREPAAAILLVGR